jgi:hypothetical protein
VSDLSDEIALEHVLWAAEDGQHPAVILQALGVPMPVASWETVLLALRIKWRQLQSPQSIELKRAA